ncbi:MAG: Enoyl-[acyl-carrier-protein] reductase [NADH] FabI [Alphaproteobacteria bacterium MarineAlpha9_Bin4]|nr:enoyl-[acyl-carrier-protein] reductase FabI [Pelagibacterales bacterium]PPR26222.1 MAG: Enoyl-[acyl-carrier-protein] reductase [NADH] FabI [Alphaproteobacteria bacterium MarineAlpha9_Bin4]
MKSNLLNNKRGLIVGVANERSLAWGIANSAFNSGGSLAFTYQSDALKKRIIPLAKKVNSNFTYQFDVQDYKGSPLFFKTLSDNFGKLDFIVHAVAFSDKDELNGDYVQTSKENFLKTMEISCYSFTSLIKNALPYLNENASLLTLSYFGAEKVIPHYNVMGIAKAALETSVKYLAVDLGKKNMRVNAISAGPVRTLAASGISDFRYILKWNQYNSPLERNITLDDVGGAGVYLLSDLSSGTTGEILHVDAGYNVIGMKNVNAPDISKV